MGTIFLGKYFADRFLQATILLVNFSGRFFGKILRLDLILSDFSRRMFFPADFFQANFSRRIFFKAFFCGLFRAGLSGRIFPCKF